jgi:hypothetical protein
MRLVMTGGTRLVTTKWWTMTTYTHNTRTTMGRARATTNKGRRSTHRHANEQLLVGWMAGAPGPYDNDISKPKPRRRQTAPPPPPGPDDNTEHHAVCYGGGCERGGEDDHHRTTRHPPHAYELMLIGWTVGAMDNKRETTGKWE